MANRPVRRRPRNIGPRGTLYSQTGMGGKRGGPVSVFPMPVSPARVTMRPSPRAPRQARGGSSCSRPTIIRRSETPDGVGDIWSHGRTRFVLTGHRANESISLTSAAIAGRSAGALASSRRITFSTAAGISALCHGRGHRRGVGALGDNGNGIDPRTAGDRRATRRGARRGG